MATCFRPHMIPRPSSLKPSIRGVLIGHGQLSLKRASSCFLIRSSINNNQFFEDRSEGIICYRDGNGEIVCEGYDEGPRFQQKTLQHLSRDMEIIDLLQQNWIQIAKASEVYGGEWGFIVQEDINTCH